MHFCVRFNISCVSSFFFLLFPFLSAVLLASFLVIVTWFHFPLLDFNEFDDLCCCCVECNSFDCFSEPMLCLFFDFSSCLCFCRSFSEKESFKMMKMR